MSNFVHLHCHTQYSLLDGAAAIPDLYKKAVNDGMRGITISDHGNMFGVFSFVAEAGKWNKESEKIKPIVACEFYVVENRHVRSFTKEKKDKRYHQLLIAKNAEGYKNLVKLCSLGYIEGLYGKYPRIDKELIVEYHKGLIATSCCLGAMVPKAIIEKTEAEAEEEFKWWYELFGEDYYIELQRHGMAEQERVNHVLRKWAAKYDVKMIATNDSHYVDQKDFDAHDILLCINTGEKKATPVLREFSDDDVNVKGKRFGFFNDQFYFKSSEEMKQLFHDVPEAIDNTMDIFDKVEKLKLKQDILLPHFNVPIEFQLHSDSSLNQWEYLRHLTLEGAHQRYHEFTAEIEERINFELHTIKTMGFAGYFLVVADFIKAGRDIGVLIGPGRGSAAGSVVAFCIGITNIDPIKYKLLFERFLNPDRKSLPDIDTDFDDEGRQKVIDYVVKKYGQDQVAQIITYGTMAAKSSIKDVARVMDLPLKESYALADLVPTRPNIELGRLLHAPFDGEDGLKEKEGLRDEELESTRKLRNIYASDSLESRILKDAEILEGSVRNVGIHAAGIIIAPKDLKEIIPVCTSKETELLITQFEGKVIEDAGVIKMDFLGLKTLSYLRDALILIKENHGIDINIDEIPLDDKKTLELYQRAETNGTFQFESGGMQKYLRDLKPDKFEDLIAMNALFRPGPMEYIPDYVARKHGRELVTYDLPEMSEILEETYGITVYQEQVMLLSQKLADFTKGDADTLRKAMGKKDKATLDNMKSKFMSGAEAKGHHPEILKKIWSDWESFAQYAFNKSHSTCYAFVAFQTAYLKAHYPAEYMAAYLTNNMGDIKKVSFIMEECRRIGVPVLGPDVNESGVQFAVNKQGQIRFALSAIKGLGDQAVQNIVDERKQNGNYTGFFDFVRRCAGKAVNKKSLESLIYAGALDTFSNIQRHQYFYQSPAELTNLLETALRYASTYSNAIKNKSNSLFGDMGGVEIPEPPIPNAPEWSLLEKLNKEKEVIGMFISGHPLNDYRLEIESFCTQELNQIPTSLEKHQSEVTIKTAGIVSSVRSAIAIKTGNKYCRFTLEDYNGSHEFALYNTDFLNFGAYALEGNMVYLELKVMRRREKPDELFEKITSIRLLSELREKHVRNLILRVNESALNSDQIQRLHDLIKRYPGKAHLKLHLESAEFEKTIDMNSHIKVDVCKELLDELQTMNDLRLRLS